MNIFDTDEDRRVYLQLIKTHLRNCGVAILAWCLMTNHIHFIAVPEEERSLAKAFGEVHRLYTQMKNFRQDVRGYLLQGRFASWCPRNFMEFPFPMSPEFRHKMACSSSDD